MVTPQTYTKLKHESNIKEELSYAYLLAIASKAGFFCEKTTYDFDSVDITIKGKVSKESMTAYLGLQLKARTNMIFDKEGVLSFSIEKKNYDDLREKSAFPRLLVLFVLPKNEEEWVTHSEEMLISRKCAYWTSLTGLQETDNETSATVKILKRNVLSPDILFRIMQRISKREPINNEI